MNATNIITTNSEQETLSLAAKIARTLKVGDLITLRGRVGAGKSVLARGLIWSILGEKVVVPSPTFTLVQAYPFKDINIYHYDLYRLQQPEEIFELNFEEALQNITIIEWPEIIEDYLPNDFKEIIINSSAPQKRQFTLNFTL